MKERGVSEGESERWESVCLVEEVKGKVEERIECEESDEVVVGEVECKMNEEWVEGEVELCDR